MSLPLNETEQLQAAYQQWETSATKKKPGQSDAPVKPPKILYTPLDLEQFDYQRELGLPGQPPFTRGVHKDMYRKQLWTMRQFAGFGTAQDTNKRYKFLLKRGQTGLSVAFDFPTIMGYDSDHSRAKGEVGRCGVAIASLANMETLFSGIPLDKISTSMTINGPASILLAFYIAVGEKQGVSSHKIRGTIQNDILKEYTAQKSYIFPPKPSIRIITDIMAFCADHVPQWNTISISGYHIREAGSTAVQELAFTLADGFAYVEAGIAAGLDVDIFTPRLSFFFNAHQDFFGEIAKYRAARRIWARHMKEKYKAKNPKSWMMRFHTQTAGCSLTAQQPENNIIRTAYEALSAVLGGTQSLHTNSMDETFSLPTEHAAEIALRTQQIIGYETGVINTVDPLGGSYYLEALTNQMEAQAEEYFQKINQLGGVVPALEQGFFQREIANAAYQYQKEIETKKRIIVGINEFVEPEETPIEVLKIKQHVETKQRQSLKKLREHRDNLKLRQTMKAIRQAARDGTNLMPKILEAVRAYATLGEIIEALKQEFGEYREPPTFW